MLVYSSRLPEIAPARAPVGEEKLKHFFRSGT